MEIWKSIPGFDGYEASDMGNIRSFFKWRDGGKDNPRLKSVYIGHPDGKQNPTCYRHCRLKSNGGKAKTMRCATLVLLAFIGPPPNGHECCHNNGNSLDDRLENLRWDTRANNNRDKIVHGTTSHAGSKRRHPIEIVRRALELRQVGKSISETARDTGLSKSYVSRISQGKVRRALDNKQLSNTQIKTINGKQRQELRKYILQWAINEYDNHNKWGVLKKIAKRAGISYQYLNDITNGRRIPNYYSGESRKLS